MNTFEEIHKLNGIEYAVRQIEAMVAEGTTVEDALKSMRAERAARLNVVSQQLTGYADLFKLNAQIELENSQK